MPMSIHPNVEVTHEQVAEFCRKWKIVEFDLFGSVLRDDFRPDSDIDVLVTFAPDVKWRLSHYLDMQEELEAMFGRKVDLIERKLVEQSENWIRRRHILTSAQRVYAV
jgi:hypothetical protein